MMLLRWAPFTRASYRQTMGRILSTPRACSDFISDAKNQPTTQPESHQKVCFFGSCCKWGKLTSARLRTVLLKWRYNVTKWHQLLRKPKKADIWRRHQWFSWEITSGERAQKVQTDDVSLPRSGECFWLVMSRGKKTYYLDLESVRHQYGISELVLSDVMNFAGKSVKVSWDVGCFLRLLLPMKVR